MAAVDRPVGAVIEAAVAKIGGVVDLNAAVVHGKPSAGTVRVHEHERAPRGGARVRAAHGNHRQRGGDCNCGADEKSLHLVLLPARYVFRGNPRMNPRCRDSIPLPGACPRPRPTTVLPRACGEVLRLDISSPFVRSPCTRRPPARPTPSGRSRPGARSFSRSSQRRLTVVSSAPTPTRTHEPGRSYPSVTSRACCARPSGVPLPQRTASPSTMQSITSRGGGSVVASCVMSPRCGVVRIGGEGSPPPAPPAPPRGGP